MRCWSVVRPLDVQQTKRSVGAMSRVLVATAEEEEAALLAELSELDKHKSSAADVDPEPQPQPQPEPEPELELEPELMQKLRQDWEPEAKPEPEAEPEPEPEQVQAAPTISAAKAEAEAEAEAEVSPLLDDPNLSEGFLGPSSIEEQGITLSAKLPVAVAVADASGSGGACAALEALLDLPADAHTQAMQAVEAERDTLMSERDAALSKVALLTARLAAFEGTP
jgi:hypothetical protein